MLLPQYFVSMGGLPPFAASAKGLGQFPQTGHSPKDGETQRMNDCGADIATIVDTARATLLDLLQHQAVSLLWVMGRGVSKIDLPETRSVTT
jgi:hypothetical protein